MKRFIVPRITSSPGYPDMKGAAAQLIACRGLATALRRLRAVIHTGQTEQAVAHELRQQLSLLGFPKPAFRFIVAGGPNAANPHHRPTNRRLRRGELIKIDFGIVYRGWCTDVTRTLVLGRPTARQRQLFSFVRRAQRNAATALKPGVTGQTIDAIARQIITRAGYGKYFIHATGHGVGRSIHQPPYLSASAKGKRKLKFGDVVTIEPGIYIPKRLGIRLEDMYVITKTGARCLSAAIPSRLIHVP